MNGQMMNYEKYSESLKTMNSPLTKAQLPKAKIDCKSMFAYAESKGKRVSDLTEKEQNQFIKRY